MVKKASKFEVHSGNSLKASNSKHTKLYCKQSLLVRKYDMNNSAEFRPKDLDSQLCDWDVGHNDVSYSLNKKGRWLLPELIKDHIHSAEVGEQDIKVSLLEHHKLKRQANCVSYHASKGETTSIVPKKGYFDQRSVNGRRTPRQRNRRSRQTRHEEEEVEGEPIPVEPQIIYDVFYPCRKTSSITHNPKYICKDDFYGHANRSAYRRSKLTTSNYLEIYDEEVNAEESLEDVDFDEDLSVFDDNLDLPINSNHLESSSHILEVLLDRTLKATDLCDTINSYIFPKTQCQEKKSLKDKKDCIVYLDEDLPADFYPKPKQSLPTMPTQRISEVQTVHSGSQTVMPTCRVLLSSESVSSSYLQEHFQDKYYEADCHPRKFAVDFTQKVTEICQKRKLLFPKQKAWSWLIFTDKGTYDNGLKVFRVHLNSELGFEQPALETLFEMNFYTMDEVCESVAMFVESCSVDSIQKLEPVMCATSSRPALTFDLLRSLKQWKQQTYHSSQSHQKTFADSLQKFSQKEDESPTTPQNSTEFCNICFASIDFSLLESEPATALQSCDHWFCNTCWREHFQTSIQRGVLSLQCPEFDCTTQADNITVLSLTSAAEYKKFLQHCHDNRVQRETETTKWCPNPKCGRILKAWTNDPKVSDAKMCLTCDCGLSVCFQCLEEAHWPATCHQAKQHMRKMKDLGDEGAFLFLNTDTTYVVDVKYCPKCYLPINKNGGCPYMECRCGHQFCWLCLVPWASHRACMKAGNSDKHGTTKRVLRHEHNLKNRPKFYLIALTHRYYRQPKMMKIFRKNERVLKNLLKDWGVNHFFDIESVLAEYGAKAGSLESIQKAVEDNISQIANLTLEIHFVIENTAVLLQDGMTGTHTQLLWHIIDRMEFIAGRFEQIFENRGNQDLKPVLAKLQQLQSAARRCLVSLISSLAAINAQ
ncbi:uncharacterized protein LOC135470946 [Liolophura sinensis]|uniref:uncharacterized protein LOC135470946 n=1 Tax=Liolophura sinensis TaxID=3198878 RepID=UPI0031582B5B